MEIDFNYIDKFKATVSEALIKKNINKAMFMFGLFTGTKDSMRKIKVDPFLIELKDFWQYEELRQVQNGWDDTIESPNIPYGILFLVNQLKYVIEYKKSQWSYYYLLGNAIGLLNSDEIKCSEFQYFINKVPTELILNHSENFVKLINDFLLKDLKIRYNNEDIYFYYMNII